MEMAKNRYDMIIESKACVSVFRSVSDKTLGFVRITFYSMPEKNKTFPLKNYDQEAESQFYRAIQDCKWVLSAPQLRRLNITKQ